MIAKTFKTCITMSNYNTFANLTFINILSKGFDKPIVKPWSLFPILFVSFGLVAICLTGFYGVYLKKKNNSKLVDFIVFGIGILLIGLEIYHEVTRYFALGHYDFSSFPFQFCSVPMYICIILPFIKKQNIKMTFVYFLAIYGFIGGIFPLLFGQGQLCRWPRMIEVFRSFLWHVLILMISIILINFYDIGRDKNTLRYFFQSFIVFFSITAIAQILNTILHYAGGVNYPIRPFTGPDGSQILLNYKNVSNTPLYDPDIASLFYISPFFQSNMPVFGKIWVKLGWIVNYILYLFSFFLMGLIVTSSIILIKKIYYLRVTLSKKENKTV